MKVCAGPTRHVSPGKTGGRHECRHPRCEAGPSQPLAELLVDTLRLVSRLRQEVVELEADRATCRDLLQQSLHALTEHDRRARQQAERYSALRDELRRLVASGQKVRVPA